MEEGENVRFQCVIGGHPLPWSTWDKNGVIVMPASRVRIMDRDDLRILEIEHVTMDDSGLYRITLENEYGRIETTARLDVLCNRRRQTRLTRAVSASPRRPYHWTRRIRGHSTAIGGRLALACDIRGKSLPPNTRRFYCNGEEVQENERTRVIVGEDGFSAQLVIEPVMKSDEGIYMCIAEFDADEDESESKILMCATEYLKFEEGEDKDTSSDLLQIKKSLIESYTIEEGVEVDLICKVNCRGDYEYIWFRDGKTVPNGEDFLYIDHGSGVICLRLLDPFVVDSGEYTCVVRNSKGAEVQTKCQLDVVEKPDYEERNRDPRPEFVTLPAAVYTRTGADVTFQCQVIPDDAEVQWLLNGNALNNEMDGVAVSKMTDIIE